MQLITISPLKEKHVTLNDMIYNYILERYPEYEDFPDVIAAYRNGMKEQHAEFLVIPEKGFCTFSLQGEEAIIWDVYIEPAYRKQRLGSNLAREVARYGREAGCTTLTTQSEKSGDGDRELGKKVILACGFVESSEDDYRVIYKKGLN